MRLETMLLAVWKHNNTHFFLSWLKTVTVWVNGSRIAGRRMSFWRRLRSPELTKYTFACCFITLKFHLLKTSSWMHDYCPMKCFLIPQQLKSSHNSTLNFESCLFLSVLFSGLLLNFTVVSLPLPEYSLQCFYFPRSVLF